MEFLEWDEVLAACLGRKRMDLWMGDGGLVQGEFIKGRSKRIRLAGWVEAHDLAFQVLQIVA